jgi:hypothetical protein
MHHPHKSGAILRPPKKTSLAPKTKPRLKKAGFVNSLRPPSGGLFVLCFGACDFRREKATNPKVVALPVYLVWKENVD